MSHHPKTVDSFERWALSGDVCPNPGPGISARNINMPKCNTCGRTVARNHSVVRCQSCQFLYHIKCSGLTLKDYHRYEFGMNRPWMFVSCLFSALPRDQGFILLNDSINSRYTPEGTDDDLQQAYNNESNFSHRQANPVFLRMAHLNINSIQNKFDELRLTNDKLKTGILVITETKIDSPFSDSQFKMENYRPDRQGCLHTKGWII